MKTSYFDSVFCWLLYLVTCGTRSPETTHFLGKGRVSREMGRGGRRGEGSWLIATPTPSSQYSLDHTPPQNTAVREKAYEQPGCWQWPGCGVLGIILCAMQVVWPLGVALSLCSLGTGFLKKVQHLLVSILFPRLPPCAS